MNQRDDLAVWTQAEHTSRQRRGLVRVLFVMVVAIVFMFGGYFQGKWASDDEWRPKLLKAYEATETCIKLYDEADKRVRFLNDALNLCTEDQLNLSCACHY
jgi:hypothetical protein